nr:MAG TPA: hypothetical protein [Caudoviricetes sp.]
MNLIITFIFCLCLFAYGMHYKKKNSTKEKKSN